MASASPILLPVPAIAVSIVFSSDDRWLAIGSSRGVVQLWSVSTLAETTQPVTQEPTGAIGVAAFDWNGRLLATGGRAETKVWDVASGTLRRIAALEAPATDTIALAFSPDSRWLATAERDGSVQLWQIGEDAVSNVLRRSGSPVGALAFSDDNRWLVAGSEDGSAHWQPIDPGAMIALACRVAGRDFTLMEWGQYFPGEAYRRTCQAQP
jgi:WD40 repeat protein